MSEFDITFEAHGELRIKVETDNKDYILGLKDYMSHHVEGYRWMADFQCGKWDGRVSLLDMVSRSVPYGVFLEVMKYTKREWPDLKYDIREEVKMMYRGLKMDYVTDLLWEPYEYQDDCIQACLRSSKGIIRSATASGKSLMISYVLKALWEADEFQKAIIIVPSVGLVTQFYNDMEEYGMDMSLIGRVGDVWKEWDNHIVISTWQSLQNSPEQMSEMDVVIVDEVHGAKAKVVAALLEQADQARWRFGFTGTMPDEPLDYYQVMQYLGPILREYGSVELAKLGYVAPCLIKRVLIDYDKKPTGDYNEIKNEVFTNPFRLGVLTEIIRGVEGSILMLVGKVKDEGEFLKDMLSSRPELEEFEIEFLSGRDSAKEREKWRKYMDKSTNTVLIATYAIFQQGINIKSLKNVVLASPFKSKIRVLQSIGRALRLHADKDGALVWDICDNVKHLKKHTDIRLKHYLMEGFDMEDIFLHESNLVGNALFD